MLTRMSITSLLSSYGFANGRSSTGSSSVEGGIAAARLAAARLKVSGAGLTAPTSASSGNEVNISGAAYAAAAAKDDNAKDFGALAKEVRSALDKQYEAGVSKGAPNLGGMTGRALAAIALNRDGDFSKAEVGAAKLELREEMRDGFMSAVGTSGSASGMATYSKSLVSQYDGMSDEEREARGWTDKFRATNASFAANATVPSLFDQLG